MSAWPLGADMTAEAAEESAPITTLAEAVRTREISLANLRWHEFETRSAEWVLRSDVAVAYRENAARVRTIVERLPGRVAPAAAACTTLTEIRDVLRDAVHETLTTASGIKNRRRALREGEAGSKRSVPPTASKTAAETAKVEALGRLSQLDLDIAQGTCLNIQTISLAIGEKAGRVRERLIELQATLPPVLFRKSAGIAETVIREAVARAWAEMPDELPLPLAGTSRAAQGSEEA